jgi:hypothetical protein
MIMRLTLLALFVLISFTVETYSQKPSVYPGAVRKNLDGGYHFLSSDSYEKIKEYYQKEAGRAPREDTRGTGISSEVVYVPRMPDPDAVFISMHRGNSKFVNRVFTELGHLTQSGSLSVERYDGIKEQYNYLSGCYFVQVREESGSVTTQDDMIYQKYRLKAGFGGSESMTMEEAMEKARELMSQGRRQEGAELMKKTAENIQNGIRKATSAEAVDVWIECLEELASVSYAVEIYLQIIDL